MLVQFLSIVVLSANLLNNDRQSVFRISSSPLGLCRVSSPSRGLCFRQLSGWQVCGGEVLIHLAKQKKLDWPRLLLSTVKVFQFSAYILWEIHSNYISYN